MIGTILLALLLAPPSDESTHARPPVGVSLEVTEPTRLLAAGYDYAEVLFERLSEEHPGRFTFDEDEEVWSDSRGEYVYDEDEECYWREVSAEELTRGRQEYVQFCASCHGYEGDGYGRSGQALRPPPRNFTQGMFKFTKVNPELLPSDEALLTLIKNGLDGTPMYPWAIPESRLRDIVTYIKSLSPEDSAWRDPINDIGEPMEVGDDPWAGREAAAVKAGEKLYHETGCYNCHPGYLTPSAINTMLEKDPETAYREGLSYPKRVENSSYEVLGDPVDIVPPDFTWHDMRVGRTVEDVARTMKAGIPGAGMPTWEFIPSEDIWAVAHYIRHLVDSYKDDRAARAAFMAELRGGDR